MLTLSESVVVVSRRHPIKRLISAFVAASPSTGSILNFLLWFSLLIEINEPETHANDHGPLNYTECKIDLRCQVS